MGLGPELERKLAKAQRFYLNSEYPKAIELLLVVIRERPNLKVPFVTLSMIHEEMGDPERGLSYLLIAAQVQNKDPDTWAEVALKSHKLKKYQQARTFHSRPCSRSDRLCRPSTATRKLSYSTLMLNQRKI